MCFQVGVRSSIERKRTEALDRSPDSIRSAFLGEPGKLQIRLHVEIERDSLVRSFHPNSYRFLDESPASGRMALGSPCIRQPSSPCA
jgi:hypothetical protein